jgi:hypothetical protein
MTNSEFVILRSAQRVSKDARRYCCVRARAWIAARRASTASGVTVRLWALEALCSWASASP